MQLLLPTNGAASLVCLIGGNSVVEISWVLKAMFIFRLEEFIEFMNHWVGEMRH